LIAAGAGGSLRVLTCDGEHVVVLDEFFSHIIAGEDKPKGLCCVFLSIQSGLCVALLRHVESNRIVETMVFFTIDEHGNLSKPQVIFGTNR
jgi:hypothetical protein